MHTRSSESIRTSSSAKVRIVAVILKFYITLFHIDAFVSLQSRPPPFAVALERWVDTRPWSNQILAERTNQDLSVYNCSPKRDRSVSHALCGWGSPDISKSFSELIDLMVWVAIPLPAYMRLFATHFKKFRENERNVHYGLSRKEQEVGLIGVFSMCDEKLYSRNGTRPLQYCLPQSLSQARWIQLLEFCQFMQYS